MKITNDIIPQEIFLLIALCLAFNLVRVTLFNSTSLLFILYDLFLGFLPFIISSTLLWHVRHAKASSFKIIFGCMLWLIFFPNAPYLMTEFLHLNEEIVVPAWFDILLIFLCAWVGLEFAYSSVRHIEELMMQWCSKLTVQLLIILVFFLSGIGIYLGRIIRLNSWNLLSSPKESIYLIMQILINKSYRLEFFYFTILFFIFMWGTYTAWRLKRTEQ